MNNSIVNVPNPVNEPIKEYKPGSPEKESVLATYKRLKDSKTDDLPPATVEAITVVLFSQ